MHVPSSIQMDGSLVSNVDTILVSENRLTQHRGPHLKRKRPFKNSIDRFVKCNLVVKVMDHRRRDLDCTKLPTWIKLPSLFHLLVAQLTKHNSSTVWVRGGASGLDKRQCMAQLTIFADGEPRVKPLLIFRGKGKRISLKEQLEYDKRVVVRFQPNAWCDQPVMNYWVKNCWKPNIKVTGYILLINYS